MPYNRKTPVAEKYHREVGMRILRMIPQDQRAEAIEQALHKSLDVDANRRLKQWSTAENVPSLHQVWTVLDIVNRAIAPDKYDANWLLAVSPATEIGQAEKHVSEIHRQLSYIVGQLDDHALGLEGLASRLTIRMLQELRGQKQSTEPFVAGVIMDREIMIVESFSTKTELATVRLDYNVGREQSTPWKPGRFLDLVARNVQAGQTFHYIMPGTASQWKSLVAGYKDALQQAGVERGMVQDRIRFAVTSLPMGTGFVILHLDVGRLRKDHGMLADELVAQHTHPSVPGVVVMINPGSKRMHGSSLMDAERIPFALDAWTQYLKSAKEI